MTYDLESDVVVVAKFEFRCELVSDVRRCMKTTLDFLRRAGTKNLIPNALGTFYNYDNADILLTNFGETSLYLVGNIAFPSVGKETDEMLASIVAHIGELVRHLKAEGEILFGENLTMTITKYFETKSYQRVFHISAPADLSKLELFDKISSHGF